MTTKKRREVEKRFWLKMKTFCITKSLDRKLKADKSLTDEQREWLAYIQNKIIVQSRDNPTLYTNVGRKYFKDRIGSDYKLWISYLVKRGELDVNGSYKPAKGHGWPMSFRIQNAALRSGTVTIEFERKKIQPPRPQLIKSQDDKVILFVEENLKKLTVAHELSEEPDPAVSSLIHDGCYRIFHRAFNLRRGKNCRRLYHGVIEMPKGGRANLELRDSKDQLFEYDVKSCHPVLMLNLFTDQIERQKYASLLQVDIYVGIAASIDKALTREEVKEAFHAAINSSNRDLTGLKRKWVYQFFQKEFPTFTDQVLKVRTDLAIHLQNEEAKIMVDDLGQFCQEKNLFWIPCHDGWMGTEEHEKQIIGKVHELFHAATGFSVTVSKLELVGRKSLSLFTYSHSGSYVGGNGTSNPPSDSQNPWTQKVEDWRKSHSLTELQEGAIKRSKARERQKVRARLAEDNMQTSSDLAKEARKVMKKLKGAGTRQGK